MATWMLTGGAGYIGAHVLRALRAAGHDVVVLDDLTSPLAGRRVPADVPLVRASVLDHRAVGKALVDHGVRGVVHLAARKSVEESVDRPGFYYRENVDGVLALLEAMDAAGVGRLVFSSSAAVYGTPPTAVVDESSPTVPLNPYGRSKLAGEWVVSDAAGTGVLAAVSLRYFNVVGAAEPALADVVGTNLFPRVLTALAQDRRPVVFGADYPTPDGTCIRDYIHVVDLAAAHLAALEATGTPGYQVVNVGCGRGYSVLEVLAEFSRVVGRPIEPDVRPRRPGDPASVVAAVEKARRVLGWTATRDLEAMVTSSWDAVLAGATPQAAPVPPA